MGFKRSADLDSYEEVRKKIGLGLSTDLKIYENKEKASNSPEPSKMEKYYLYNLHYQLSWSDHHHTSTINLDASLFLLEHFSKKIFFPIFKLFWGFGTEVGKS